MWNPCGGFVSVLLTHLFATFSLGHSLIDVCGFSATLLTVDLSRITTELAAAI